MASISRDPGGRRRIQFVGADGRRRAIRLGKMSQKVCESVAAKVETLVSAAISRTPWDNDTAAWVGGLDQVMYEKIAKVDLIPPREAKQGRRTATLGAFLNQYIEGRTDIKPSTRSNLDQVRRSLLAFFGADKSLTSITPGDADQFRVHELGRLSENTVRRNCGRAKQLFRAALRKRLIQENPFGDMKGCAMRANPSRFYFITPEQAQRVLDACPDAQWRLLFVLSRYGGLRCPSEHLSLRWADVDWGQNRITVRSPKTEHHEGGESRQIPIFQELRPYLEEVWDRAEPGTEYVITRYRDCNANLRTQLNRIIRRAGLEPWPKLFQNLRSTRETELAARFPMHVVCAWIGNSQRVAAKHYLQVRDEDFARAAESGAESGAVGIIPPAQNPAQPASATTRQTCQETPKGLEDQGLWQDVANCGSPRQSGTISHSGAELAAKTRAPGGPRMLAAHGGTRIEQGPASRKRPRP